MTITDPDVRELVLAFADDEHLMGQAHTEWIGVAPFLEEDLAFASIGQDELGHAAALYELLDDDVDGLALGRDGHDYRSCDLTERACDDWAAALVRHWLYDEAEALRWEALASSSIAELAAIAERAQREETFHRRHAEALLDALASSPEASDRLRRALTDLLPIAASMFEPPPNEAALVEAGVVNATLADQRARWQRIVSARFASLDWTRDDPSPTSRHTRSADFGPMYERMREVISLDPAATW